MQIQTPHQELTPAIRLLEQHLCISRPRKAHVELPHVALRLHGSCGLPKIAGKADASRCHRKWTPGVPAGRQGLGPRQFSGGHFQHGYLGLNNPEVLGSPQQEYREKKPGSAAFDVLPGFRDSRLTPLLGCFLFQRPLPQRVAVLHGLHRRLVSLPARQRE